jgi:NAD(P)-dependent dehydrogenase (short-subunit alcohol dehydrogenase family)
MRHQGRTALVTGAGSGIGAAIAQKLAGEGAQVWVSDKDMAVAVLLAAAITERGGHAKAAALDISDETEWSALCARIGRLDALVNNAGIGLVAPLSQTALSDWRRVMSINLDGVFLGLKHAFAAMAATGGAIVNIASVGGMVGTPGNSAYCASKAAVLNLTRTAAIEGAALYIRVNAVCPGFVDTASARSIVSSAVRGGVDTLLEMIPMRRPGAPSEIADAVSFLLSDEARYITGAALTVDGGQFAQ